ncbi:MAG: metallophosphoesterase [Tenericutes bacterium]|nr:metallophosphoesterase [Mycoplasmatota bacterium]
MKLLLFSDNHRDRNSVKKLVLKHKDADRIFSLGDSEMKEQELSALNIVGVRGNYPFEPNFPKELTFEYHDVKVYFTHGHYFSVKMGLSRLLNFAVYNHIDIVCFGHTHRALLKEINGVIFINPGALSKRKMFSKNSYAILEITETLIKVDILTLSGERLLKYKKQR